MKKRNIFGVFFHVVLNKSKYTLSPADPLGKIMIQIIIITKDTQNVEDVRIKTGHQQQSL